MTPLNSEIQAPGGQSDPNFFLSTFPVSHGHVCATRKGSHAHTRGSHFRPRDGGGRESGEIYFGNRSAPGADHLLRAVFARLQL